MVGIVISIYFIITIGNNNTPNNIIVRDIKPSSLTSVFSTYVPSNSIYDIIDSDDEVTRMSFAIEFENGDSNTKYNQVVSALSSGYPDVRLAALSRLTNLEISTQEKLVLLKPMLYDSDTSVSEYALTVINVIQPLYFSSIEVAYHSI